MNCKVLYLPFFLLILSPATSQNLVPNGSFEEYSSCPDALDQLQSNCLEWFKSIQVPGLPMYENPSPDFFHGCAGSNPFLYGTPINIFGFQEAQSGVAYAGLLTYSNNTPNSREYIGTQLETPLSVGEEYLVTFFLCRGGDYIHRRASNNIGLKFTTYSPFKSTIEAMTNFAHFNIDSVITDDVNWLEVSFNFEADSSYAYLHIGNFFDDEHTEQFPTDSSFQNVYAYYFIDNVSVEQTSSTDNFGRHKFKLFPSPCIDQLNLRTKNLWVSSVEIYSVAGKLIENRKTQPKLDYRIDINDIEKGLYIIRLYDKTGISFSKTFLKL